MTLLKSPHIHAERAWAQLRKLGIKHEGNPHRLNDGFAFAVTDETLEELKNLDMVEMTGNPPLYTLILGK